ncbi:MAG TPA: polyphosphate kinase [Stellaceae bacterium]|nr:polyphosphate kinase [Stellaceae bacterium]
MADAVKATPGFTLAGLDLGRQLRDEAAYKRALAAAQIAMLEVEQAFRVSGRRGIIVFEGWDAGGKGGTIQRLTAQLDPRWMRVWAIGKPSPDEQGRHYLWRFWEKLPPPGHIAVFDRSWYGRVLVERVEGLIARDEWRRAYREINEFEGMLIDDGVRLVKIFLHVSAGEQLKRLAERIADPLKHWKIEGDDIRNYASRRAYIAAMDEMFEHTSIKRARWHVVAGEHKWFARVAAIRTAVKILGKGIELGPPPVDKAVAKTAAELLNKNELAALGLRPAARDQRT